MARRDGKGPNGDGPQTGRGLGYCGDGKNSDINGGRGNGSGNRFRFRNNHPENESTIITLLSEIKELLTKKDDSK